MQIKVSLILPSLNVKQYIRQCLESAISQTLQEIEIICVDAGSDDGTLEIINEFANSDDRVKVIHSDIKSYGHQMNIGMEAAKGEYIGIIETDDYVPCNMYGELYSIAHKNNLDFVKSDFYRFTGEGEKLSKAIYELAGPKYTNRVINIVEEQECFNFSMNTWSGIYKRQFLLDNGINHNETLGASYQDNGFWFQTFMYAKRAYFYNKPFYMNRRDNPNSSVYNKNKVFCICDEYERLWEILQGDEYLKTNFSFIYSKQCFRAYKGNLNRIAEDYREDFLVRFSEWFRMLREKGALDFDMFQSNDWKMLLQIMQNPREYYEINYHRKEVLYNEIKGYEHVIIFGAGLIGRRVYDELTYCNNPAHIDYFAVSKPQENYAEYKNIKICHIDELKKYKDSHLVVVATMAEYHKEIENILQDAGFKKILIIPEDNKMEERNDSIKNKLSDWYEGITGKNLNIDNPITISDYLQKYKLCDDNDKRRLYLDKCELRKIVRSKFGDKYLAPIIGIYDKSEDVPIESLNPKYYIKCSHGSGMITTIDAVKKKEEIAKIRRNLDVLLKKDYSRMNGFEEAYSKIPKKLIVEPIIDGKKQDVYKVVCFEGRARLIIFDSAKCRYGNRRRDVFDIDWNRLIGTIKWPNSETVPECPKYLAEMLRISETVAKEFAFVVGHFFVTQKGLIINEFKFNIENGLVDTDNEELNELIRLHL